MLLLLVVLVRAHVETPVLATRYGYRLAVSSSTRMFTKGCQSLLRGGACASAQQVVHGVTRGTQGAPRASLQKSEFLVLLFCEMLPMCRLDGTES